MDYGNTAKHVRRLLITGLVLGAILIVTGSVAASRKGRLGPTSVEPLLLLALGPAALLSLIGAISTLFRVRVFDGRIQCLFAGCVTAEAAVADYESIVSGSIGPVLRLKDGSRIKLGIIHLRELQRLRLDLDRLTKKNPED